MRFIVLAVIVAIIAYASAQAVCVPGAVSSFTIDNPPAATEASTTFPLGIDATVARIEVEAELISDPSQPHTCDAASPGVDGLCLSVAQEGQNVILTNKAECAALAGLYKVVQVRLFFGAGPSAAPSSSAPETSSAPVSSSAAPASSSAAPSSSSASPSSSAAPGTSASPSSSAAPASSSAAPASSSASPSSSAAPATSGSPSSAAPETTQCSCNQETTTAKPNVISGNNNAKASSATKVAATSAVILAVAVALL